MEENKTGPPQTLGQLNLSAFTEMEASPRDLPDSQVVPFTLEQVTPYFTEPIADVAQKFGICLTQFKAFCRQLGIERWPYRSLRAQARKGIPQSSVVSPVTGALLLPASGIKQDLDDIPSPTPRNMRLRERRVSRYSPSFESPGSATRSTRTSGSSSRKNSLPTSRITSSSDESESEVEEPRPRKRKHKEPSTSRNDRVQKRKPSETQMEVSRDIETAGILRGLRMSRMDSAPSGSVFTSPVATATVSAINSSLPSLSSFNPLPRRSSAPYNQTPQYVPQIPLSPQRPLLPGVSQLLHAPSPTYQAIPSMMIPPQYLRPEDRLPTLSDRMPGSDRELGGLVRRFNDFRYQLSAPQQLQPPPEGRPPHRWY